jgi:hypothetical protein
VSGPTQYGPGSPDHIFPARTLARLVAAS